MNAIGQLSSLEELSLQNNLITTLPKSIGLLKLVRRLYIDESAIQPLPEEAKRWIMDLKNRGCLNPA